MSTLEQKRAEFRPSSQIVEKYISVRGSVGLLPCFLAVYCGIRRAYDDWIPCEHIDAFEEFLRGLNLTIRKDVVFNQVSPLFDYKSLIGGDTLTTTRASGMNFRNGNNNGGLMHVFVGSDKSSVEKCATNGWYPLIANNSVIHPPYGDVPRFGKSLGYPDCCIRAFLKYNDWQKNCYYVRLQAPERHLPKEINSFLRHLGLSYIFHLPCSWQCEPSRQMANQIRQVILEIEPALVELIDLHLEQTYLVLSENRVYLLEDAYLDGAKVYYANTLFCGNNDIDDVYGEKIRRAEALIIDGGVIRLLHNGNCTEVLKFYADRYAPEIPLIFSFG